MICDQACDDLVEAAHSTADAVLCEQECLSEVQPVKTMVIAMSLGRRYRSPAVRAALRDAEQQQDQGWRDMTPELTVRERDLIDLWVEGLGDRQAAERLGVSYATVRSYGPTVRQKLGVGSRAQVVLKVLKLGLARAAGS
ncbi:MAG: LuxR C-terminal-related transcriptional regulator [Cyanobium sp.]